jgi:Pyruvate/2-oxoacid:ferredoxin oxidoreductase gamma subunit
MRAGEPMEREIIFTGVGGQGIQLMAKVLAQTVVEEGKCARPTGSSRRIRGRPFSNRT